MKRAIVIAALMLAFAARAQDAAPWWGALAASDDKPDVLDGLVAWWKLDEGAGTTAYDSSGNGYHGTLVNSPVWTNGLNGSAALSFNNGVANQEVYITNFPANGTNAVTIMAFGKARLPQASGFGIMAGWGWGVNQQWWYVGWVANAPVGFGGGTYAGDIGVGIDDLTGFHHVAATFNGGVSGATKFYGDGALLASSTASLNLPAYFRIGRGGDGANPASLNYFFNGAICQIRVYNRALSSNEVSAIYNRYK